jgi:hypothetical protein
MGDEWNRGSWSGADIGKAQRAMRGEFEPTRANLSRREQTEARTHRR